MPRHTAVTSLTEPGERQTSPPPMPAHDTSTTGHHLLATAAGSPPVTRGCGPSDISTAASLPEAWPSGWRHGPAAASLCPCAHAQLQGSVPFDHPATPHGRIAHTQVPALTAVPGAACLQEPCHKHAMPPPAPHRSPRPAGVAPVWYYAQHSRRRTDASVRLHVGTTVQQQLSCLSVASYCRPHQRREAALRGQLVASRTQKTTP